MPVVNQSHMTQTLYRRALLTALATASITLGLAGCQTPTNLQDPNVQPAEGSQDFDKIVYLQDFPIPRGTKWDNSRTLILGSGKGWTGRLAFTSPISEAEAFQFFQEHMTKLGWQPISLVRSKTSILAFARNDRAALVEFTGQPFGGIAASITVTPR